MNTDRNTTIAGGAAALGIAAMAVQQHDPLTFWMGLFVSVATAILGYLSNK